MSKTNISARAGSISAFGILCRPAPASSAEYTTASITAHPSFSSKNNQRSMDALQPVYTIQALTRVSTTLPQERNDSFLLQPELPSQGHPVLTKNTAKSTRRT
ncbi:hypothetical protein GGR58DRAFT_506256 [Xylaria digitata]|nr:hypothetical protein GGR58DRAFT_506256 [Xylaria digitata]